MRLRILIALFALGTVTAEIALDPSTAFVRVSAPPAVGRLVVVDRPDPALPDAPPPSADEGLPSVSPPAHAAVPPISFAFRTIPRELRHAARSAAEYVGPIPPVSHRPPIV